MLTGGEYPALSMVSSNIFGLSMMNSGLTRSELREMLKFKVFGTVLLENVPQLFCQALYSYSIGGVTDTVLYAFVTSILSVISTSLSYAIDQDDINVKRVSYYLSVQCTRESPERRSPVNAASALQTPRDVISSNVQTEDVLAIPNDLTSAEKRNVLMNRGRTLALSRSVAALWCVPPKCIEVGATILTKHGALTHIVQSVDESDLKAYALEFHGIDSEVEVTPLFFVKEMIASSTEELTQIFCDHFGFDQDFSVSFYDPMNVHGERRYTSLTQERPRSSKNVMIQRMLSRAYTQRGTERNHGDVEFAIEQYLGTKVVYKESENELEDGMGDELEDELEDGSEEETANNQPADTEMSVFIGTAVAIMSDSSL